MGYSTAKAGKILSSVKETISSFYKLYDACKDNEKQQQAILKSIIVFSCSGIDAVVKQLINDCLEGVIERNEGSVSKLKDYTAKRIKNKGDIDNDLLSDLLTSNNPRKKMIDSLIEDLSYPSLQSPEELFKVASYFDIKTNDLESDKEKLARIFKERNIITHQFDVDFSEGTINVHRSFDEAKRYSDHILLLANKFIEQVDLKLNADLFEEYKPVISYSVFG